MSLRHKIFTLGVTALAALPAGPATAAPAEPATTHHAVAVARPASPEAEFLIAVHQGNLAQIAAGKLAARKSDNRVVRKLGKRFAAYHKKLDAQVKRAAVTFEVRLPGEPNSEQLTLVERYRTATAAEFDALFVETQLAGYEHAAKLARLVLKVSTAPAIVELVELVTPVISANQTALTAARDELAGEQPRQ
jgi:putative membrane protein